MKKYIPVFSVIIGVILAAVIVLVMFRTTTIEIESFDQTTVLSLGKARVSNYNTYYDGTNKSIEFNVSDQSKFYKSNIETSEYYLSNLSVEKEKTIRGYLLKNKKYFSYYMNENRIKISSVGFSMSLSDEVGVVIVCDAILEYNYDSDMYDNGIWLNSAMTFDDIKIFYENLGKEYYSVSKDVIYVRGLDSINGVLTNYYVLKISKNGPLINVSQYVE